MFQPSLTKYLYSKIFSLELLLEEYFELSTVLVLSSKYSSSISSREKTLFFIKLYSGHGRHPCGLLLMGCLAANGC